MENHNILTQVLTIFENAVNEVVKDERTVIRRKADNNELKKQLMYLSINLNKELVKSVEPKNPRDIADILKKMMN